MENNKQIFQKKIELFLMLVIISFILIQAIINNDSVIALISAVCGITYTFFAGKGYPFCYLFGLSGSGFYSFLAFQNSLWGNLILYLFYYIPMQIIGYHKWNKNLKTNTSEIIKVSLSKKELLVLILILSVLTTITYFILLYYKDSHPILDSVTTVFSIGGMYLTVKRAIEQWIFWAVVNGLSVLMWINVVLSGAKAYSTLIMWAVYFFLAIYFYIQWKKELAGNNIN